MSLGDLLELDSSRGHRVRSFQGSGGPVLLGTWSKLQCRHWQIQFSNRIPNILY